MLPLNAFARELLTRLGLGGCQFHPNVWRLVVSMQVLWREVLEGDCALTVDEFLYCYKPSEINQSLDFFQFTVRGKDCRLIKSLVTSFKSIPSWLRPQGSSARSQKFSLVGDSPTFVHVETRSWAIRGSTCTRTYNSQTRVLSIYFTTTLCFSF